MFNNAGKSMAISLCALVVGVLIGGCLDAAVPRPNHIHLTVMPYQEVNLSPQLNDVIDWVPFDRTKKLTIHFSDYLGAPCKEGNLQNTCTFNDSGVGVFPYNCDEDALCPDPGLGPRSKTGGGANRLKMKVLDAITYLFRKIDFFLGVLPEPAAVLPGEAGGAPTTPPPAPSEATAPRVQVKCDNSQSTAVNPVNIVAKSNQSIYWIGSSPFTLSLDQSKCQGNTSTPSPVQQCKLIGGTAGQAFSYSITDTSCTTQPTITTSQITPQ